MVVELKVFQLKKVLDIAQVAGYQVIHSYDMIAFFDKPVTKMRTQKACRTGY
jgi:hypothetical protein